MSFAKDDATEKIDNIKIKIKSKMEERKNKKEEENSQKDNNVEDLTE